MLAKLPQLIEKAAVGLSDDFVVEDDFEGGVGVWALAE